MTIKIERSRRGKRAKRFVPAGTLRFRSRPAGANKVAFRGKVGKRKLRPGRYRATIVATDGAGNRSQPRRTNFVVAAPQAKRDSR